MKLQNTLKRNAVEANPLLNREVADKTSRAPISNQHLLYVLMVPSMAMIFSGATFGVALPTLRTHFGIEADMAAWLLTAYTLPFMIFMPLYGRLGDSLGKRNLILAGMAVFLIGTLLTMTSTSLATLLLGRAIQGAGLAGIAPLSMAIIHERFPSDDRGRALGTWNSIGPVVGIFGPVLAGVMVDYLGWRTIFLPTLLIGIFALVIVWLLVPSLRTANFGSLRTFDWPGVALLVSAISFFVFYISSRPITGVEPLRDWRLLLAALFSFAALIWREKRRADPFLELDLFGISSLRWASIGSGIRMFTMSGISFLMPLYLTDVHDLSASTTGILLMLNAAALLATMRKGGQLADRWGSRRPVMIGMTGQSLFMAYFALLPADASLILVGAGLVGHGLSAGLSLAALHRASLRDVPVDQNGAAAGIYSMIRFGGMLLGAALGGVLLQQSLTNTGSMVLAYQTVFWLLAAVAFSGIGVGWKLGNGR
jgi:MFS family permease